MQVGQRVRRVNDGQVGFVVAREEGGLGVQLDRKHEKIIFPLPPGDTRWVPDEKGRLTPHQVARIAYDADKALRQVRGEYGLKDWQTLPETTRIGWVAGPPSGSDEERMVLFMAIKGALSA